MIEAELLDPSAITEAVIGCDAVIHFAANADIRGGLASPRKDLEQNTLATFNVLEAMRESGVKRILFSSTAAALGEPTEFPTPETCAIPDQTSLYGASKMACEGLISSYCEGFGFEGYVYRFVSILGPRYPHGHVYDFVKQLLADPNHLNIIGDGSPKKSYLHVHDCVNAVLHTGDTLRTANQASKRYQVYHLGAPEYCQVKDSASWICNAMSLQPELRFGTGARGWIGDNPFVYLNIEKILSTGWKPTFSIRESVEDTVAWLISNPWIFESRE